MSDPKWHRDRVLALRQMTKFPLRWVMGADVPIETSPGRLWMIPEPERRYRVRSKVAPYRVHRSTTKAGSR